MFSGQGSNYYQMGRELFQEQFYFRAWMEKGDWLAQKRLGTSLLEELYAPTRRKNDRFTQIRFSHPAIFLVEYSLAQALIEQGLEPDYLLGVSMGSFAALAGALTFEDAMLATIEQAEALETHCQLGGMIAILDSPDLFEQTPWLQQQSALAGVNFDKHFVISASQGKLMAIQAALKETATTAQDLPVSYAFHSPEIDSACASYSNFLQDLSWQAPQLPFICCATATERIELPKDYLWMAVREPIRFQETIIDLETRHAWTYIDVGPSGTLATFVKYILAANSASDIFPIMTPFGQDVNNLEQLLRSDVGR
ncbi:acyltransferase domain-containing protein [Chloroflexi bacterium TSY]|nr:acyltransferase domain-containing protein [Chloroflexi bacterium TSY]